MPSLFRTALLAALPQLACGSGGTSDATPLADSGTDAPLRSDGGGEDARVSALADSGDVSSGFSDDAGDALFVSGDDGGAFACGTLTCNGRSQICEVEGAGPPGGPHPGEVQSCPAIPAACDDDVTCACVQTALRPTFAGDSVECSAAGSDLTVTIAAP